MRKSEGPTLDRPTQLVRSQSSAKAEAGNDAANRASSSQTRPPKRTIRHTELFRMIPLAKSTIYRMEQRGEFPRRFFLTPRCVVWDLSEVEAWIDSRRRASDAAEIETGPFPDVHQRKRNPVRQQDRD